MPSLLNAGGIALQKISTGKHEYSYKSKEIKV
jgi:hypothetical protein